MTLGEDGTIRPRVFRFWIRKMRAHQTLKTLCLAFLAVGLCGVLPLAAQDDPYRNIHSIGVISALGNEVTLQNWGVTRFTNDSAKLNLDWNLDTEVSQRVSGALRGRFAVRDVPADAVLLRSEILKHDVPDRSDVPKYLQSLPSSAEVDAYVAILPGNNSFMTPYGLYQTEALGAFRREGLFSSNVPIVPYAAYDVLVVDAKTGKLIGWSYGNALESRGHSGMMSSMCNKSFGAKTMLDLTDGQKAIVRDELRFLVLSSLPNALKHVGLPSSPDMLGATPTRPSICLTP